VKKLRFLIGTKHLKGSDLGPIKISRSGIKVRIRLDLDLDPHIDINLKCFAKTLCRNDRPSGIGLKKINDAGTDPVPE
jgi:hypothetical protein